jgi:hypothetical protein
MKIIMKAHSGALIQTMGIYRAVRKMRTAQMHQEVKMVP